MTPRRYDESWLSEQLSRADDRGLVLAAASCAERLFALYEQYAARSGQGDPARLRAALDVAWRAAAGDGDREQLAEWRQVAEELVPDEDEEWTDQTAFAEHAAAAVAYALRTAQTADPREAVWCARQLYEAADYAAQQQLDELDLNQTGAEGALADQPVVQAALAGIAESLEVAVTGEPTADDVTALKRRAQEGGGRLAELADEDDE